MLDVRYVRYVRYSVQKPKPRIMLLTYDLPTMNYLNYLGSALHSTETTRFQILFYFIPTSVNKVKVSSIDLPPIVLRQILGGARRLAG